MSSGRASSPKGSKESPIITTPNNSTEPAPSYAACLVRDRTQGMKPRSLLTGFYGTHGEKIRHVVHDGALQMPLDALQHIMEQSTLPRDHVTAATRKYDLPTLDAAVIRPCMDHSLGSIMVTELNRVVVPALAQPQPPNITGFVPPIPAVAEQPNFQTVAVNRVLLLAPPKAKNAETTTERIRGGGGEGDEDTNAPTEVNETTTSSSTTNTQEIPAVVANTILGANTGTAPATVTHNVSDPTFIQDTTNQSESSSFLPPPKSSPLAVSAPATIVLAVPPSLQGMKVGDTLLTKAPATTASTLAPVTSTPVAALSVALEPSVTQSNAPNIASNSGAPTSHVPASAPVLPNTQGAPLVNPTTSSTTTTAVPSITQAVPSSTAAALSTAPAVQSSVSSNTPSVSSNPSAAAPSALVAPSSTPVASSKDPAVPSSIPVASVKAPAVPSKNIQSVTLAPPVPRLPPPSARAASIAVTAVASTKPPGTSAATSTEKSVQPSLVQPLSTKPESQWVQLVSDPNDGEVVDPKTPRPPWYQTGSISSLERTMLPEWFDGSAPHRTPQSYRETREKIMTMSDRLGNRNVTATLVRRSIVVGDAGSLIRLHSFLNSWGLINEDAINDTTPTGSGLRIDGSALIPDKMKRGNIWDDHRRDELMEAVVEQANRRKRPKLSGEASTADEVFIPIDWDAVADKVGNGASSLDCEREFLAMPIQESVKKNSPGERSITPDITTSEHKSSSPETANLASLKESIFREIIDQTKPDVLKVVTEAASKATTNNLAETQRAAIAGLIASQAAKRARSEEDAMSHILSELVDHRMQKIENRMALMDDMEGILEAERVCLELERRDLYTTRCRHWFGGT